jgi:flagellar hook-length control protein FliK
MAATAGPDGGIAPFEGEGGARPPGFEPAIEDAGSANDAKADADAAPEDVFSDVPKAEAPAPKPVQAAEPKSDPAITPPVHQAGPKIDAVLQGHGAQQAHAPAPLLHQVPLGAVPIEIGLKSLAGINRFEIRLDPVELGRIDVRLDIDDTGEVKAQLVVDRVETLALLQRDARTLERAFEQAGLKPSEGGVDISLRDPSGDGRGGNQSREDRGRPSPARPDGTAPSDGAEAPTAPKRMLWRGASGVDLRI